MNAPAWLGLDSKSTVLAPVFFTCRQVVLNDVAVSGMVITWNGMFWG